MGRKLLDNPVVSLGTSQDGSRAALPAWAKFMAAAHDTLRLKRQNFDRPDKVIDVGICSITKDLPTNLCEVESEIFIKDTEPTKVCKVHRRN